MQSVSDFAVRIFFFLYIPIWRWGDAWEFHWVRTPLALRQLIMFPRIVSAWPCTYLNKVRKKKQNVFHKLLPLKTNLSKANTYRINFTSKREKERRKKDKYYIRPEGVTSAILTQEVDESCTRAQVVPQPCSPVLSPSPVSPPPRSLTLPRARTR